MWVSLWHHCQTTTAALAKKHVTMRRAKHVAHMISCTCSVQPSRQQWHKHCKRNNAFLGLSPLSNSEASDASDVRTYLVGAGLMEVQLRADGFSRWQPEQGRRVTQPQQHQELLPAAKHQLHRQHINTDHLTHITPDIDIIINTTAQSIHCCHHDEGKQQVSHKTCFQVSRSAQAVASELRV